MFFLTYDNAILQNAQIHKIKETDVTFSSRKRRCWMLTINLRMIIGFLRFAWHLDWSPTLASIL